MRSSAAPWTLHSGDFDLDQVRKLRQSVTTSLIIPARDEAATIGAVIDAALTHDDLLDEVLVVDDHSSDDTATVAKRHGATVIHHQGQPGKGSAMASGLQASTGSLVVFLDGDVENTDEFFVAKLLQPLLIDESVQLVKGYYERPLHNMPSGGGRVNELSARPILSLLYPGLGEIRQPLAGETAARRELLTTIGFGAGYDVEIGLLIDCAQLHGVNSLAQVDLGVRRHRNRPLEELRPMSLEILRAALSRYGVTFEK
jgi:glucosyl-3-phosphoglycerate synthase